DDPDLSRRRFLRRGLVLLADVARRIRPVVAAALFLGIGWGYRPELILMLFPLFICTVWPARQTGTALGAASALLLAIVLGRSAILLTGVPAPGSLPSVFRNYLAVQAADTSPLYGAPVRGWISMLAHLASWNA